MATYVIGDIQGCFEALQRLLHAIAFEQGHDRLWLAGDLVNRGPKSLHVLRWARDQGKRVRAVLGNHDLHLLAASAGLRKKKSLDTLDGVLAAKDCGELIDWLRHRPLLVHRNGHLMVHAGLHPAWTIDVAKELAGEIETRLRSDEWKTELAKLYNQGAPAWSDDLRGIERLRSALAVMVSIRCLRDDGSLCSHSGAPEDAPKACRPWFERRNIARDGTTFLFGHWAALGHRRGTGWLSLDSGCVWGGKLTSYCIDDDVISQVAA